MITTPFDKHVDDACAILRTERRKWGDTFADVALEYYRRDTAKGRKVFLRNLIGLSKSFQFAIDAVRRIGEDQLGKTKRAPRELEIWMAKTKVPQGPVYIARGREPNTNMIRNRAIIIAVSRLANRPNMTATRNASRGEKCSFVGGSACDAVGLAVERVYPKEPKKKQPKTKQRKNEQITYKTIERIWFERTSHSAATSPSRLILPFFLKLSLPIPAITDCRRWYDCLTLKTRKPR